MAFKSKLTNGAKKSFQMTTRDKQATNSKINFEEKQISRAVAANSGGPCASSSRDHRCKSYWVQDFSGYTFFSFTVRSLMVIDHEH